MEVRKMKILFKRFHFQVPAVSFQGVHLMKQPKQVASVRIANGADELLVLWYRWSAPPSGDFFGKGGGFEEHLNITAHRIVT